MVKNLEEVQQRNRDDEDESVNKTVESLMQVACSFGSISQEHRRILKKNMTRLVLSYKRRHRNQEEVVEDSNTGGRNDVEEDNASENEQEGNFLNNEEAEDDNNVEHIREAREEAILNGFKIL